jgi:dTDP-4-amino-4,6-dideoxygalactose transaminase
MKSLDDYANPFEAVKDFENRLKDFTGAPYAIVTDCCTHAMEIVLRIQSPKKLTFPGRTYLSVVMLMHKLGIDHELTDHQWAQDRRYQLLGSSIWDCARYLEPGMFRPGEIQCLSFNRGKPLAIGKGGAILTDDPDVAERANRMRYDGRDIFRYSPWIRQKKFELGFHYYMRPEECIVGMNLLHAGQILDQPVSAFSYPDCREIEIID